MMLSQSKVHSGLLAPVGTLTLHFLLFSAAVVLNPQLFALSAEAGSFW
jgi:hypothetical protein